MKYVVKETDVKYSFGWVRSVVEMVVLGLVLWAFITQRLLTDWKATVLVLVVALIYVVYAIVIVQMEALTPGYTYMVIPTRFGVVFSLEVSDTTPVKLFVPFIRIRPGTDGEFNLWKLSLYLPELLK